MKVHLNNNQLPQSGMSLIEMVVVISIYAILSLAISSSITEFYKFNSYTFEQADEVENARRGMTQWNRDAKELTTAEDGSFAISVIDEYTFGYFSDTDIDGQVEYVRYQLTDTTLYKYTYNPVGSPPVYNYTTPDTEQILSLYVRNIDQETPMFTYFDNAGVQLASTSPVIDVRYIQAEFIINIDPLRSPGEFMLRSSIAPRNLKDNL